MNRVLAFPKPATANDFTLYDALPSAIFLLDEDDRVLYANSGAAEIFSQSQAALHSNIFTDFLDPTSSLPRLLAQTREDNSSIREYGHALRTVRGGTRMADAYIAPFQPEKKSRQLLVMLDAHAHPEKLGNQHHQREVARVAGVMAAMLAHEVKNPLSGIRGAAQLLEETVNAEDARLAMLIRSEVDRIAGLLGQIEYFSHSGLTGASGLNIHEITSYAKQVAETGFARGVRIEEHYDPSLPPVHGNREQLLMVVTNLLKNAAEALKGVENPTIRLITSYQSGMRFRAEPSDGLRRLPIRLRVEDNGPGVAAALQPTLFEPFVTGREGGKGLGLAIAAKIVGDHGGMLEFGRRQGWTSFSLSLPRSEETA